jgi:hypothetical protein
MYCFRVGRAFLHGLARSISNKVDLVWWMLLEMLQVTRKFPRTRKTCYLFFSYRCFWCSIVSVRSFDWKGNTIKLLEHPKALRTKPHESKCASKTWKGVMAKRKALGFGKSLRDVRKVNGQSVDKS